MGRWALCLAALLSTATGAEDLPVGARFGAVYPDAVVELPQLSLHFGGPHVRWGISRAWSVHFDSVSPPAAGNAMFRPWAAVFEPGVVWTPDATLFGQHVLFFRWGLRRMWDRNGFQVGLGGGVTLSTAGTALSPEAFIRLGSASQPGHALVSIRYEYSAQLPGEWAFGIAFPIW